MPDTNHPPRVVSCVMVLGAGWLVLRSSLYCDRRAWGICSHGVVLEVATMPMIVFLVLLVLPIQAFAQQRNSQVSSRGNSIDPMNRPMDELGITGKDDTLCSDRWYSCTSYDRQQFDQKYPGRPLNELLRFGEPDWPNRPHRDHSRTNDSLDPHDRLDKSLPR
jgi:hypothetical protein